MKKKPIGVIDSGVGGLSVWKEIVALLPHESTLYLGDSKYVPYGTRTKEEILRLSRRLVKHLLAQDVKIIVIACNTITVSALEELRNEFPRVPLIGTVPVVKRAVEVSKNGRIGILSTIATANSKYQKNLIKEHAQNYTVINKGTDALVPLVEKGDIKGDMISNALRKDLENFMAEDIDVLALGCTHFPFVEKEMKKILGKQVTLLNSGSAIARQVYRVLEHNNIVSTGVAEHIFYTTGDQKTFAKVLKKLIGKSGPVQQVTLL